MITSVGSSGSDKSLQESKNKDNFTAKEVDIFQGLLNKLRVYNKTANLEMMQDFIGSVLSETKSLEQPLIRSTASTLKNTSNDDSVSEEPELDEENNEQDISAEKPIVSKNNEEIAPNQSIQVVQAVKDAQQPSASSNEESVIIEDKVLNADYLVNDQVNSTGDVSPDLSTDTINQVSSEFVVASKESNESEIQPTELPINNLADFSVAEITEFLKVKVNSKEESGYNNSDLDGTVNFDSNTTDQVLENVDQLEQINPFENESGKIEKSGDLIKTNTLGNSINHDFLNSIDNQPQVDVAGYLKTLIDNVTRNASYLFGKPLAQGDPNLDAKQVSKLGEKGGLLVDMNTSNSQRPIPVQINQTTKRSETRENSMPRAEKVLPKIFERIEKVVKEVERSKDGKTISLRLDPPELGKVKIDVSIKDGSIHARVVADSNVVNQLLRDHGDELQSLLRRIAPSMDQAIVSFSDDASRAFGETLKDFRQNQGHNTNSGNSNEYSVWDESDGGGIVDLNSFHDPVSTSNTNHWVA